MKYFLTVILTLVCTSAFADSCAQKFIGNWMVRLNSGQTYVGHHLPGGVGTADCPGCSPGKWTCQGNQIFKSVNGMTYTGVLSANGNTITEPYGTLTRMGGAAARSPARDTGQAEQYMKQARAAGQYCTYADQTQAAGQYLKASDEFEAAGDASRAARAKQLAAAASAKSYECDRQKQARGAPVPSPRLPNDCHKAQAYMMKLIRAGEDVTSIREAIHARGCG